MVDNFVKLLPSLYGIEECMYIQLPCLIPLLFPRVLGHGSLALTSAFVFEAFIAHLVNQFSGTRGLPKKLNGGKTRSKPNRQGVCSTEMQIHTQCY